MNCIDACPRAVFILMCSMLFARAALATENGQQHYAIGSSTVLNAIIPAPGHTQFYNYTAYYHAGKIAGNDGGNAAPSFKANVLVNALRILHTWDVPGIPFELATGIVVPFAHVKMTLPIGNDSHVALGDIVLHGLHVSYQKPDAGLFSFLAFDFAFPTGGFSESRIANVGLNSYGFMPNLNFTWFPYPRAEFSAALGYEINSPNRKTHYHSGNIAFFDWIIGYSVRPDWQLGLQGYVLRQTTDDKLNGRVINNGFKGQVFAIGPQIRYNLSRESTIIFKWQHELGVRNRPDGNRIWIQFTAPM